MKINEEIITLFKKYKNINIVAYLMYMKRKDVLKILKKEKI